MSYRVGRSAAIVVLAGSLSLACALAGVREQNVKMQSLSSVEGTVSAVKPGRGSLVVLLLRPHEDPSKTEIINSYTRRREGRFRLVVSEPGTYALAAFQDLNDNLTYDLNEPARPSAGSTFELASGEHKTGFDLVIEPDTYAEVEGPIDVAEWVARSAEDQLGITIEQLTAFGDVVDLADPRFGAESGQQGHWRPFDFVFEQRPGVYFLEPFDPRRTPVLYVHGITGYPQEFTHLIESLDRERFQPWFYFYPSGARLGGLAEHLSQVIVQLSSHHDFDDLHVVAHSMGGLVSRAFILEHHEVTERSLVNRFVTISTPWGGQASAERAESAPSGMVLGAWKDMAPKSDFLRGIFYLDAERTQRRNLPSGVSFFLLFGHRNEKAMSSGSTDSVVSLASMLRYEAEDDAVDRYGYDETHTSILRAPATAERVGAILSGGIP